MIVDPSQTDSNGEAAAPVHDPFDPAALRVEMDLESLGVKKLLTTVKVMRPAPTWFVRVHPDPDYSVPAWLLDLKDEQDGVYFVDSRIVPTLAGESALKRKQLFTAITRNGDPFLWPVNLPGDDGRLDDWSRSAQEAAIEARKHWLRLQSNRKAGYYDCWIAPDNAQIPEPKWPDLTLRELLKIAFRDRLIDSYDHVVLRKLRGEL